jgi:predicted ATP-dependent endonuclease of OLD family
MAEKHKSIVRVVKDAARHVTFFQVKDELFSGQDGQSERYRLQMTTRFDPAVNEVFFTKRVVLLEEDTALVAFERAAEITGVFTRHPEVRRDVIAVSCNGKGNIPAFQQVLNHFDIPYTVVYDEDQGNLDQQKTNARIDALLGLPNSKNKGHMISPTNLEGVLGYPTPHKDKPYHAAKQVEALAARGALPPDFMRALNLVYFGQNTEPA